MTIGRSTSPPATSCRYTKATAAKADYDAARTRNFGAGEARDDRARNGSVPGHPCIRFYGQNRILGCAGRRDGRLNNCSSLEAKIGLRRLEFFRLARWSHRAGSRPRFSSPSGGQRNLPRSKPLYWRPMDRPEQHIEAPDECSDKEWQTYRYSGRGRGCGAGCGRYDLDPTPCRRSCIHCFRLRFPNRFSRVLLSALSVPVLPAPALLSCARLLSARGRVSAVGSVSIIPVYAFGRLRAFRICDAANHLYASAWVDQRARRILPRIQVDSEHPQPYDR